DHEIFDLVDQLTGFEGEDATFYSLLGVEPTASVKEIGKAHRKLSLALQKRVCVNEKQFIVDSDNVLFLTDEGEEFLLSEEEVSKPSFGKLFPVLIYKSILGKLIAEKKQNIKMGESGDYQEPFSSDDERSEAGDNPSQTRRRKPGRKAKSKFFDLSNTVKYKSFSLEDFILLPNHFTSFEQEFLLDQSLKKLKRVFGKQIVYQESHFDDVIHGYRECQATHWGDQNDKVIETFNKKVYDLFPKTIEWLPVHILELSETGGIKPHVDNVE
ncbi:10247_t:CDS:2, partial [Racocetra fulgida]